MVSLDRQQLGVLGIWENSGIAETKLKRKFIQKYNYNITGEVHTYILTIHIYLYIPHQSCAKLLSGIKASAGKGEKND